VAFIESPNDLWICYYFPIHDEIGYELPNVMAPVMDRELSLLLGEVTIVLEFNEKSSLIQFFI